MSNSQLELYRNMVEDAAVFILSDYDFEIWRMVRELLISQRHVNPDNPIEPAMTGRHYRYGQVHHW